MKIFTTKTNYTKTAFAFLAVLFCLMMKSELGLGQTVTTLSTPGSSTFTVPAGVTSIKVEVWGAGGGGGAARRTSGSGYGGGGGGGAYNTATIAVTPGQIINYTIAAGGAGGNGSDGADGGNSVFNTTTANGGLGGNYGNVGVGAGGAGGTGVRNGGAGASGSSGSSAGGGGGGGAGNNGNGVGGSNSGAGGAGGAGTPNAIPYIGGNGGARQTNSSDGNDGSSPGGGGGGGRRTSSSGSQLGGDGGNGQIVLTYTPSGTYKDAFQSMSIGSTTWCAGETRTISVTVKNTGTAAWTDISGVQDINIGVKWDADPDYLVRTDVGNLAANATGTFSFTVTAPVTTGTNHLTFDVVYEAVSWFGNNSNGVGPGNFVSTSAALTINALPAAPTGNPNSRCGTGTVTISATPGGGQTIDWYAASSGGSALLTGNTSYTTPSISTTTTYYAEARNTTTGCKSATRTAVIATVNSLPSVPTAGNNARCGTGTVTITATPGAGETIDWYAASSGGSALLTGNTSYTTPSISTSTTYYAEARNTTTGCKSSTRTVVTATVNAVPVAPTAGNNARCGTGTVTITATPGAGETIDWYSASSGGSALLTGNTSYTTPSISTSTTYYAEARNTTTGCKSATRTAVIATVNNIAVPTGPASQLFCTDANPTVANLSATGTAIQWYSASSGGTALAGSTALVNGAHYYATQTDGSTGCESATRLDVTVTIYTAVSISTQPQALQIICASFPASFSVTATGDVTGYQWYLGATALTDNSNTSGSQTATLNIDQVSPADAGFYHVVISGTAPCGNITSNNAELQVNQNIIINTQPAAQTVCTGNTAIFSVTATGTGGLTYQWRKNGVDLSDIGNISGSTTATLSIANVSAADIASYRVLISDGSFGCPNVISINAVLGVSPTSVGGTVNSDASVCSGTNGATLTLTGKTGSVVRWEFSTDNFVTIITPIANTTTSQSYSNLTQTTQYRTVVQSGVCPEANSVAATITVNPIPNVIATPSSQPLCSGNALTTIALTGSVTGTTFAWTRDNTASVTGIAASGNGDISGTLTNLTNAPITVTFTITPTANTCVGTVIIATVIVNPTATVTAVTNKTFCNNGSSGAINFTSPTTGGTIVYNWTNNTPSIGLAASGSGNIASFTATNAGTAPVTATITVTPSYTNGTTCTGTPITFTITVNPVATINTVSNQTVCKGAATTAVTFTSPATGGTIVYNWTNNTPSIGLAASGSGTIASFTAANITSGPVTATITVTPSYTNGATCAGTPITFTITVNPAATVTAVSNQTVCNNGATTAVTFSSPTTGGTIVYNWTNNTPSIGLAASGSGNIASFTATNAGTAPVTATITVTPSYTNGTTCTGTPITFTITVNPTATVTAVTNKTFCNNGASGAINFTSPTTGGTIVYNWTNNTPSIGLAASGSGNIASFTATNASTAPVTATITVTPSYTNGTTCTGTPITFTITVNPVATINTVSNQTVCKGAATTAVTFTSPATGGTIVYNWTNNTPSIGLAASGSGDIASFTATNAGTAPVTATITVTPSYTNGTTCTGTPIIFTITVNPTATVTAVTNKTFCNNGSSGAINFTSPTTGGTIVYNWTNNTPSIGLAASGSGNIASFTATNAGTAPVTATITVTPSYTNGTTCTGTPITFTITVNPVATINTVSNQTVCKGAATTAVTFTSPATGGTIVYNWTNNTPSIGLAASGSGTIASFTAANITSGPVTATITVTPSYTNGATCAGTPITFTITVNPAATVTAVSNQTVCNNGATTAVTFSSPTTGGTIVYNWTNNTPSIGLAASGSGNIASFTATNAGTAPVTATITVTPSYTNGTTCTGTPITFTITVNPKPNAIATPASQTKCEGFAITTIALTSSATPAASVIYTWTRDNAATVIGTGSFASASGSGNITGTPTVVGSSPITVTFTITPTYSGGCVGTPIIATVTVNPQAIAGAITGPSHNVCIGSTLQLSPSGSTGIGTLTYAWTSSNTAVATINSSGLVTGVGTGTTNITYTVNDANGCVSTTSSPYSVTVTKPTAGAITQASGITDVCVNSTLQLTSNANGTGVLTYTWFSSNTAAATVSNTGLVTGIAAGSTNITYTVTDGNGCSATSSGYAVTVLAIPTGTLTPSATTICAGQSVTFTFLPALPPNTGSYIFKLNGVGTPVQTGTSNTYSTSTLNNGDFITVDVSNSNNCGATFTSVPVTVTPLPVATLTADKPTTICAGDLVTFTAAPTGASNYNFKINGVSQYSGNLNSFSTNTLTTGQYVTVDITNSTGCTGTSAQIIFTVNPLPNGTLTATSSTSICPNQNVSFKATGGVSYQFRVDGTVQQAWSATSTFTYNFTDDGVVTVDVANGPNGTGCTKTYNPGIPVTVNPLPTGTIAITENSGALNNNEICLGSPVTYTFSNTGYATYVWKLNNVIKPSTGYTFTTTELTSISDVVTVIVTSGSGCTATFTASAVTVVPSPTGILSVSPSNEICAGDNVTFTVTPLDPSFNYNFKVNGITVQNGVGNNTYTTTTLAVGTYPVTVDISNGSGCIITSNAITMTVNALPTGTLSISPSSTICAGDNVTFTAPDGFANYNFLLDGVSVQNSTTLKTYTNSALLNGQKVTVAVTNTGGCIGLLNTFTMIVNPLPAVTVGGGATTICVNSVTPAFTGTPSGGAWSIINGSGSATIDAAGIVTGGIAGTVTVVYTYSNGTCSNTATKALTVNPLPAVAAISNGATAVCVGATTPAFTDATPGGTWSITNVTGSASINASGVVTGITAGSVTVVYTYSNGTCSNTATKPLTVNALPVVAAIGGGASSVCVNSTTPAFTDATPGGVWSETDGTGSASINVSGVVTGLTAGTATINYIVTTNGCSTTVSTSITINALPVPTLTGPNPICLGSTDNVYTTESGQSNYVWNVVNGTITAGGGSTDNTVTVSWLSPGPKSISVNYTDADGCSGATSATVVNAPGSSPVISGPTSVCKNSIENIYTAPSGKIDYSWTVSAGGTITSGGTETDPTVTVTWNTTGPQSVTINYAEIGGCSAATPTVLNVNVNPLPTVVTHDQVVCSPATVDLTAAAVTSGSTAGLTFSYYTDAGGTTVLTNPNAVSVSNTYYIKGTTGAGCSDIQPVLVTINPKPAVVTHDQTVCSPAPVDLTAAAVTSGSTAGLTFSYYTDAGGTTVLANPNAISVSNTYYIKGTTGAGCSDIQPVLVTINSKPTVVTHAQSTCSPATVDLTAAAVTSGSTAGLTFSYYTDAGATTVLANPNAVSVSNTYYIKGTTGAGCSDIQPVLVTINPKPTVVTHAQSTCSPATVDLTAAAVTSGSTAGLTFTYYTDAGGTTVLANPNAISVSNTYYIKGTTGAGCVDIQPVLVTINPKPTVVTHAQSTCSPATVDLTAAAVTSGSTAGLTFSYYTDAGGTTVLANPNAISVSNTYYIKGTTGAGCVDIQPVLVTINPKPTVVTHAQSTCSPATVDLTAATVTTGSTAGLTFSYYTNAGGTIVYATPATAGAGIYYIKGIAASGCSDIKPVTVTINAPPAAPLITPSSPIVCQGSIQPLLAGTTPTTGSVNLSNLTNVNIPDNTSSGAISTINVSGVPAGAIINSVSVNFNITEDNDPSLHINLKAPNSNILNLVNQKGNANGPQNFTNTTVSSLGVTAFTTNNGAAPFTGTYRADAGNNVSGATSGGGNNSNTPLWTDLYNTPNGNWVFSARDVSNNGTAGTILDWTITINYTIASVPQAVTWSPNTDLYTDAAATVLYTTGQPLSTVYVKPAAATNRTYTATVTDGVTGCTASTNVPVTVNLTPVVTITADYCSVPGKVQLTANATPAGSYAWSTGDNTQIITVDEADDYTVTVTTASGCTGTATISVARELVTNGDFELGDNGFTTGYTSRTGSYYSGTATSGLYPEGDYAVDKSAYYHNPGNLQGYHPDFHGRDHTTGAGNFMMVNGSITLRTIWEETVSVLPNTTYYFSAWGMNLNPGNPAQLRFEVNGAQAGSIGDLGAPGVPKPTDESQVNLSNWIRFYGTWTSGPTTTSAIIHIINLNTIAGGNDFGLDDISFGTLSTFITLESAPGTDAQIVCKNSAITPIIYNVGNGSVTGPNVSPLPAGVTSVFAGDKLTISGTPTVAGKFTYTITTTGCSTPFSVTGTITVQEDSIKLTAGSAAPVCKDALMPDLVYTVGGTATGATLSWQSVSLAPGVTGTYNAGNKTFTISGTPTAVAGSYPYTITTSGTCLGDEATISGTITIQSATISLNAGSNNNPPAFCINTPLIPSIKYTVDGTATGATISWLPSVPTGITGTYQGGIYTIKGTPTVAGTFNYTVITTGGACTGATATGTIIVTPAASIALTTGLTTETVCTGTAITTRTYTITDGTGASITSGALPAGVSGNYDALTKTFTISGSPTVTTGSTFNYTVTTSGGCATASISGTIIVNAQTITLTTGNASPPVCQGAQITPVVYTLSGFADGATISGQPSGIIGTYDAGTKTFTISGSTADPAKDYTYTITTSGSSCSVATITGTITVQAAAIGGTIASSTANCSGSGSLTLQDHVGTIVRWESSTDNFNTITTINNITISLNYSGITVPTQFRAIVSNTCGEVPSSVATAGVQNYWVGGTSDDWNTKANWSSNQVADLACPVTTIPAPTGTNHNPVIYPGTNAVANSLTINSGASLSMNGTGNLTLSSGATFMNNGTFTANAGTGIVKFNGAGEINGSSAGTFNNLTINGNLTLTTAPTISGNFTINSGSVLTNSPTYTNTSTLVYNVSGAYTTGPEWNLGGSGTVSPGISIPQNVSVQSGTVTIPNSGGSNRALAGNMNISTGATLQMTTGSRDLFVAGNWTNNGTFTATGRRVTFDAAGGTQLVAGATMFFDLTLDNTGAVTDFSSSTITMGDEFRISHGTMNGGTSTFIFTGNVSTLEGTGAKNFYDLQITAGANVSDLTASAGNTHIAHSFTNNGSFTQDASHITYFDKSGATETFSGTGAATFGKLTIGDGSGASVVTTLNASADFTITGGSLTFFHTSVYNGNNNTATFLNAAAAVTGSGIANFNNATANVAVNFGSSISTIKGNLLLNNGGFVVINVPNYGSASTLTYNKTTPASFNPALEWNSNSAAAGLGVPENVSIANTNSIILLADRTVPGTLNLSAGNLDINGNTLAVNIGFTGTSGNLKGSITSSLIAGGTGTINFDPSANYLKTFTVNGSNLNLGKALNIATGTFASPGTLTANTGSALHTDDIPGGGILTLKSDVNGDARVAESYGTIKGNVVVERYIPPRRAWRLVTAPVNSTQTINEAWQEGQVNTAYYPLPGSTDFFPGFGTEITYDNNPGNGYDLNTQTNPSIRYWNPAINNYDPLPSGTLTTNINAYPGYYLFVRGSRAINLSQAIYAPPDPTVLRVRGTLAETGLGSNRSTFSSSTSLTPGQYALVGNPFASAVDISDVIGTGRAGSIGFIPKQFWIWDPNIAGSYGVGGYVTYSNGVQTPVVDPDYTANTIIQSGQAFLVRAQTNSTISLDFHQEDKAISETQVFGFGKQPKQNQQAVFYTNLMLPSGDSLELIDGVAAAFGKDNSAGIDSKDASKKWNNQESIGLFRNNTWQAIEFRPIPVVTDTLFYSMYYFNPRTYTLKIIAKNIPVGFPQAWLVDKYLNTKTAVIPGTPLLYNFTATGDINTYRSRFMLVFKRTLPVTPIPVTKVINQADPGITGNANSIAGTAAGVSVHPNPVTTGEKVILQFSNMNKGKYEVTVTNTAGKALAEKTIMHDGGSNTYSLQTDARWAAGSYFIKIIGENDYSLITKLVISK